MRLMILTAALTLISGLAWAGDWSGGTVDVPGGGANPAFGSMSNTSDGLVRYGVHGGHDIIFCRLVLGPEVEFSRFDLRHTPSGVEIGDVGRLEFRTGGDFGPEYDSGLAYAIVGDVNDETAQTGETGAVYGLGLSTAVGNRLHLSGEALLLVFDDFADSVANSVTGLQSDSFSVRVSFRF